MAWSATSAPRDPKYQQGKIIALPMAATTIYKGDIVRINASGYAVSTADLAVGDMCAGIALETKTCGTAGADTIQVQTEGVVQLKKATPAQTDVGTFALHSADNQQTVTSATAEATNSVTVGTIVGIPIDDITGTASTTHVKVALKTLRQIKTA